MPFLLALLPMRNDLLTLSSYIALIADSLSSQLRVSPSGLEFMKGRIAQREGQRESDIN